MSALRRTRLLSQADAVSQRAATRPQEVLVTFDFEAQWGMPYALFYDLDRSADAILATLGRHRASAVFFVTGKIVEEQPELVSELAARGHEVGLHGYRHEDFAWLTPPARREFGQQLTEVCARVQSLVGRAPIAYRAPYLLTPAFADPDLDRMLADRKFVWTSNREIRFCEEVFRPDRVPWALARDAAEALGLFDERRVGALAARAQRQPAPSGGDPWQPGRKGAVAPPRATDLPARGPPRGCAASPARLRFLGPSPS